MVIDWLHIVLRSLVIAGIGIALAMVLGGEASFALTSLAISILVFISDLSVDRVYAYWQKRKRIERKRKSWEAVFQSIPISRK